MSRLTPLCALEEACTGMTGLGRLGVTDPYEMQETLPAPPGPVNVPVSGQGPTAFSWLTTVAPHVGAAIGAKVAEHYATFAPQYEAGAKIAAQEGRFFNFAAKMAAQAADKVKLENALFQKIMGGRDFSMVSAAELSAAEKVGMEAAQHAYHVQEYGRFKNVAQAASTPLRRLQSAVMPTLTRVGTKFAPAIGFIGGRLIPVVSIAMDTYKIYESVQAARDVDRSLDQLERQVKDNTKASADRQAMTAQDRFAISEQAKITLIRAYSQAIAKAERAWPFVREEKFQITPTKVITRQHPATVAEYRAAKNKLNALRARVSQLESSAPWARPK